MAYKMKGNPMARNFGVGKEAPHFTKQKNTNINRGDDKGDATSAFQKSAMKHDRGTYEKGLPDWKANEFHKEEVDGHRHDASGNKITPIKFVGKTIKKIKSKYKAKRQLKKGGKGEDETKLTVALSAPTKKTTYTLKKDGKKVNVSKAEYEKAVGGKAGSKLNT